MIFRRIKAHVEKENWFAVFIDFCIVVIGILIAFQITNWNEARGDAVREREVLASLLNDLRADIVSLSTSSEIASLGVDAGNVILSDAGLTPVKTISFPGMSDAFTSNVINVELPDRSGGEIQGELWKHMTVRLYPSQNDAAMESLIAAGNSSVIKDTSLVRDLLRYRTLWTGLETAQATTFRPIRDRIIFVGQEHDLSPFTPVDNDVLTNEVSQNAILRSALRTMLEYTVAHRSLMDQIHK